MTTMIINMTANKIAVNARNWVGNPALLVTASTQVEIVLNPPSVGTPVYTLTSTSVSVEFTVSNSSNYKVTYYLYLNNNEETTLVGDSSEEKEYIVSYDGLSIGDEGHFYIEFTNSVDYKKTLESYTFIVEE